MCFFFKQKTAYEMRISDWSSDVCSSDLSSVRKIVEMQDEIDTVNDVMTTQLGPEHVIVALSAEFRDELTTSQIERCVARLEARSEEHTTELKSLMRHALAHSCSKKKNIHIFILHLLNRQPTQWYHTN